MIINHQFITAAALVDDREVTEAKVLGGTKRKTSSMNNILLESILLAGERIRVHKTDPPPSNEEGGWRFFWRNPFLIRLVLTVGMGSLIIGYDNGASSMSDLPHIQRETEEKIVEDIVAVIFGPALGVLATALLSLLRMMTTTIGYCSHRSLILTADLFFIIGTISSLLHHHHPWILMAGRFFMGLGIGIANTSLPLYISESVPARIRGALVSTICLLLALGHLLSYPVYLLASKAPGTWYWMMGLTGVLGCFHFRLMQSLPESPRLLYRKDKIDEAKEIMRKTYPSNEFEKEVEALELSVEDEKAVFEEDHDAFSIQMDVMRGGTMLSFGCGMCHYFSGYSMVTYYCPLIVKLAGYTWNMTPLMLPLITSGLSAVGFIITILFVDRIGRRRLLLISMFGIISCLGFLSFVFHGATIHKTFSRIHIDNWNDTCSSNLTTIHDAAPWNCRSCFEVDSGCLYLNTGYPFHPGLCVPLNNMTIRSDEYDTSKEDVWEITRGSMSLGWLAMIGFGLYIIFYSLGMGTVPFIVNSEIYPLRFRSTCGGLVALFVWDINAFVSVTSNKTLKMSIFVLGGEGFTFLFFCLTSCAVTWLIYLYFPETNGVCIEEINYMFRENEHPRLEDDEDWSTILEISKKDYYYRIEVDGMKYRLYSNDIRTGSWKID